ncbi:MAG: helix-turn-helix domain-containing protein [Hyphomicrobiaceae bacterium]
MTDRREFYIKGRKRLPEPYHFKAVGLPDVYLLNGVTFEDDPDHGPLMTIVKMRGLLRAVGLHIVEKPMSMTGSEFRFLRKQMKLTQNELAKRMRVTDQTIANYEKESTKALGPADPHMRFLYALYILPPESQAGLLKGLAEQIADLSEKTRIPALPRRKLVEGWVETDQAAA